MNDFVAVSTDGGANAAEKLGGLGRCTFLVGVESATFIGPEDTARGVGTKDAVLDPKIPRPDDVGIGIAHGVEDDMGGKARSKAGAASCTLGMGGQMEARGNAVMTSARMELQRISPVREVKSMDLLPMLPVGSPPSELSVVSASPSIAGMGRSCPGKRRRATAVPMWIFGGGDVGPSERFMTAWRASHLAFQRFLQRNGIFRAFGDFTTFSWSSGFPSQSGNGRTTRYGRVHGHVHIILAIVNAHA